MHSWHIEDGKLARGTATAETSADMQLQRIEVLTPDEEQHLQRNRTIDEVFRQLPHAAAPFVELYAGGAAGVLIVPHDQEERSAHGSEGRLSRTAFVLEPNMLHLMGDVELCERALSFIEREAIPVTHAAAVLCELMRFTVRDHPAALSLVRRDFEQLEERLLEGRTRVDRAKMMSDVRRLLGLDTFYQGMSDIAAELAEGGGDLVSDGGRLRFRSLERQLDRLATRLESLQDYSLQLHSLYEEGIDIRQNSIMQLLTVIATIFMPLTFITSWYGMNFHNMAMIRASWGYPLVVVACVVLAFAEVLYFHRRGWLGSRRKKRAKHRRGKR